MSRDDDDEIQQLRQALADAQRRLQAVVELTGPPMGTLEFELDASGELILVHGDEMAQANTVEALADIYGLPLRQVFPSLAAGPVPALLVEAARSGRAVPPHTVVAPISRLGHGFTGFAFQSAPGRVALKFWPGVGALETQEVQHRNEQLLAQIFSNSPVAVALTRESDGAIVDVNDAWSRLTGHTRAQALGRTTVELGFWPDVQARTHALSGLVDGGMFQQPEGPLRTRDGREAIAAMHGSTLEIGGVRHLLIYLLDMTARVQAQDELRRLNAELESRVARRTAELARSRNEAEQANRYKSTFLSGMSHELRTPLNAILGFGQLLQVDATLALPARQRGYVDEIVRAGAHLLELISEVLDLARIESGKLQLSLEPVYLGLLIDDCLALLRPAAQARRIELLAPPPGAADVHVQADRIRAKQVLLNLLSNAIKYNRDGGSVRLDCVADGEALRIDVHDTGPGLSAAQQARLFQDFERLGAEQSTTQGSGIGLALSRRLVAMMGGEIGVDSAVGSGSRFWVRLPRTDPSRPAAHANPTELAPASDSAAAKPLEAAAPRRHCVLYIEDNPTNVRLMAEALRLRDDIRLIDAALPEQGLALAEAERPDLILLDIQLPGIDGYEVLRRLRLNDVTRAIPVVAVSANAMATDLARGEAAGIAHYLTKPIQVPRLLEVVDAMLRR